MTTTDMAKVQKDEQGHVSFNYTVRELENLLATAPYKTRTRLNYGAIARNNPKLKKEIDRMDRVATFGDKAINLFDNLSLHLGKIPSQREYIKAGLPIYREYWENNKYSDTKIDGYPWTVGIETGVIDRMSRAYTSKIVETHLELLLKELGFGVFTHPLVDSVLGVDLVVTDDRKRYYLHVTTSKNGQAGAEEAVKRKESRGKFKVNGAWVEYTRDFTGDIVICYESVTPLHDNSTKFINGNPVFNKDFVEYYFMCKRIGGKGELLSSTQSKLQDFNEWAKSTVKTDIGI